MQVRSVNRSVETFGVGNRQTNFRINANAKMFRILSDQLYSDKVTAFLRELGANAVDAHTDAGKRDVPIDVHLPTPLNPTLTIRDYGNGMSDDFIHEGYSTVFFSTKDDSNDAVGGLGLGKMSAFAYCDAFTIESIHNGEKRVYSVFLNKDGMPEVLQLGNTVNTTDASGVSVKIPVKANDINEVQRKAAKVFRFYDPIPNITPESVKPEAMSYIISNKDFALCSGYHNGNYVIMGNIAYPIDHNQLTGLDTYQRAFLHNAVLFMPIGSCDIAPSREALSYDKETIRAIEEATLSALDYTRQKFEEIVVNTESLYDAYVMASEFRGIGVRFGMNKADFNHPKQSFSVKKPLTFSALHDKIRDTGFTSVGNIDPYSIRNYKVPKADWYPATTTNGIATKQFNKNGDRVTVKRKRTNTVATSFTPSNNLYFVFTNGKDARLNQRLKKYATESLDINDPEFIILKYNHKDENMDYEPLKQYLMDKFDVPESRFIYAKTLDDVKYTPKSTNVGGRAKGKAPDYHNVYTLHFTKVSSATSEFTNYRKWVGDDFDPSVTKGIYVNYKNSAPNLTKHDITASTLSTTLQYVFPDIEHVYCVTQAGKNPLEGLEGWVDVETALENAIIDTDKRIMRDKKFQARLFKEMSYEFIGSNIPTISKGDYFYFRKSPLFKVLKLEISEIYKYKNVRSVSRLMDFSDGLSTMPSFSEKSMKIYADIVNKSRSSSGNPFNRYLTKLYGEDWRTIFSLVFRMNYYSYSHDNANSAKVIKYIDTLRNK